MAHLVTDVEGEEHRRARCENAAKLGERHRKLLGRQVDDRVERDHSRPGVIVCRQRQHRADGEINVGKPLLGQLDHPRRQVDADRAQPEPVQVRRDVAGPAADVAHDAPGSDVVGEHAQQRAVERLVAQLVAIPPLVRLRDGVVAGPQSPQPARQAASGRSWLLRWVWATSARSVS